MNGIKVVAQKADPSATIVKGPRGFSSTIINVCEDGSERPFHVSCQRKRDVVAKLQKLPIENVVGMACRDGFVSIELFAYNGI